MKLQRVQAFTIMEVTITMLVAAILIGITYTTYIIVSKSYLSYNSKNTDMAVLERLDELLKKDFDRAEIILKDSSGIAFRSKVDTVKYQFDPDFILRVSSIKDTFKVTTESVITSFENQPAEEIQPTDEQNRLDELNINLIFHNEKIPYYYHKQYSSADLFNRNPDAIH